MQCLLCLVNIEHFACGNRSDPMQTLQNLPSKTITKLFWQAKAVWYIKTSFDIASRIHNALVLTEKWCFTLISRSKLEFLSWLCQFANAFELASGEVISLCRKKALNISFWRVLLEFIQALFINLTYVCISITHQLHTCQRAKFWGIWN